MLKRHRRGLVILTLGALCVGNLGAGYRSRGVPGQIEFLFQALVGLAEKSQDNAETIQLLVARIDELEARLCEFHGEGSIVCPATCPVGICTHPEGDPCESENPPPACDASGGPGGD
jgi:hypothetical protein